MATLSSHIIARLHSPYGDKFGIPRQSGLSPSLKAEIELLPPYDRPEALDGLDQFSHLWLIWVFDRNRERNQGDDWNPRVRPPRLGGNQKLGVFATRSPFRPNPIGLSAVEIIDVDAAACRIRVAGADLADGTAILDIKPYVPYADSIPGAEGGFARYAPDEVLAVAFSDEATTVLDDLPDGDLLRRLITESLTLDPRPSFHDNDAERIYHMRLADREVHFRVMDSGAEVVGITAA